MLNTALTDTWKETEITTPLAPRGRHSPSPGRKPCGIRTNYHQAPNGRHQLDPCEFFRVDYDPDRLDLLFLYVNRKYGEGLSAVAQNQGCLAVDFLLLDFIIRWPEAFRPYADAGHGIAPGNGPQRRCNGFAAAIRPQNHVL